MATMYPPCRRMAGEHFTGDPMLELACLGQLRRKDEGVETAFVDEGRPLFPTHRIDEGTFRTVILIDMSLYRFARLVVPQCLRHILGTEERFALLVLHRPDGAERCVLKYFYFHKYNFYGGVSKIQMRSFIVIF